MLCCNSRVTKIVLILATAFLMYNLYNLIFEPKVTDKSLSLGKKKVRLTTDSPTFSQWKEACLRLTAYHKISNKLDDGTYANTALTADEFANIASQFLDSEKKRFNNTILWLDKQIPNLSRVKFFVQKLFLSPKSKIAIHADIHADIHSLITYLDDLAQKGYLQKDSFKINTKNFYIAFLGDYTDGGCYGAEVLYTILRLKLKNPDQVIVIKGNQESFDSNKMYGFFDELKTKFRFKSKDLKKLCKIYNYFPDATYIGCGNTELTDFVLLCHGGLEPAFDPKPLLAANRNNVYQDIAKFNVSWLNPTVKDKLKEAIGVSSMPDWLYSKFVTDTGFKWSYFLVDDNQKYLVYNSGDYVNFGKIATQELLHESSSNKNKVRSIVRGHQHHGQMFEKMIQNHGIYNSWSKFQWSGKEGQKLSLANAGPVWTLNVSPGSSYGKNKFNYDTYAILTLSNQFKDWILEPHNVKVFE